MQGLTEGRIVHFVMPQVTEQGDSPHRPAVITEVLNRRTGIVNLTVFFNGPRDGQNLEALGWVPSVGFDPNGAPGTWHWIERV